MSYSDDTKIILDTPIEKASFVVFDIEATGTSPENGDRIVELAAVKILPGLKIDNEKFQSLVNPDRDIPQRVIDIHGITNEDVANAPDICKVIYDFFDFGRGCIPIAHRASKDFALLRAEMRDYGIESPFEIWLDSLRLSRVFYPDARKHNLDAIIERFNITSHTGYKRHRAYHDALNTALAVRIMLRKAISENTYLVGELVEYLR